MKLTRQQISDAVAGHGWRLILGTVQTHVLTESLAVGAQFAGRVAEIARADGHVLLDLRDDRVVVTVRSPNEDWVRPEDIELALEITSLAHALGLPVQVAGEPRTPQTIEIGIDALDIPAVLPFWKAVLGYVQQGRNALIDPLFSGPAVWFQQMDAPRPQRNRIHFDVVVPDEEAQARIDATLAAGGKLVYVEEAPAFWVLADPEGNEACVCSWQGRDA
ncbi:MAG: VOC family protein [Streptosporangiaceae bacterium]|jgi:4a-hydroxytetrahydrobiopterin dehydratase